MPIRILKSVSKPGRYAGGEFGQILKKREDVEASVAFCFPDSYEIGMSNLGMRILYGALNQKDNIRCERVFAPWTDMEEQLRDRGLYLCTLESGEEVRSFDFLAVTLQYEMCYTNVLNVLELSGIPLLASERGEDMPIVICGGRDKHVPFDELSGVRRERALDGERDPPSRL